MIVQEIDSLVRLMSRLPGFGPRSARRAVLQLMKRKETLLTPLIQALSDVQAHVKTCGTCGNLDTVNPCFHCQDPKRDAGLVAVVADVDDLWALERTGVFRGQYHVLGGVLSAIDGVTPENLRISALIERIQNKAVKEVILALPATVDSQTTAYYIQEKLATYDVIVTKLAHGVPMGGELDYLDDGTIITALQARTAF